MLCAVVASVVRGNINDKVTSGAEVKQGGKGHVNSYFPLKCYPLVKGAANAVISPTIRSALSKFSFKGACIQEHVFKIALPIQFVNWFTDLKFKMQVIWKGRNWVMVQQFLEASVVLLKVNEGGFPKRHGCLASTVCAITLAMHS